jgi:hypothetical protein
MYGTHEIEALEMIVGEYNRKRSIGEKASSLRRKTGPP